MTETTEHPAVTSTRELFTGILEFSAELERAQQEIKFLRTALAIAETDRDRYKAMANG